jgi:hypothetical protein
MSKSELHRAYSAETRVKHSSLLGMNPQMAKRDPIKHAEEKPEQVLSILGLLLF